MKPLRTIIISLLLATVCLPLSASVADSLRFSVRGIVRDGSSGLALEALSVTLPGTSYATVTNRDGSFVIKSDIEPRFVSFSLIGYNSLTVPAQGGTMRIRLDRSDLQLHPATVIDGDPRAIVEFAISLIKQNSAEQAELFDCFYRETVQKRQRFIYVSEAVTQTYKSGAANFLGRDRAAVVKSRLLKSPRASDTLSVKILGGPNMATELDIVKNQTMVLDANSLDMYRFEMLPAEVIDGRMQFVIRFSPNVRDNEYALHRGTLYIDRQSLAFSRIEASLDMSDIDKATRMMLVRRPAGLRFRPKELSLLLVYKPEKDDGKYRLSYLRTQIRFNCDWKRRLFATDYTTVSEMVVTNRHTGIDAVPIQRADEFSSKVSLADKAQFYSDPEFWKAYNIIEPTSSLEHAIGRLKK